MLKQNILKEILESLYNQADGATIFAELQDLCLGKASRLERTDPHPHTLSETLCKAGVLQRMERDGEKRSFDGTHVGAMYAPADNETADFILKTEIDDGKLIFPQ